MFKPLLLPFVIAFILGLALTPLVKMAARRFGYVAKPRADRWHTQETALLGGIAIFFALIATVGYFSRWQIEFNVFLVSVILMFLLGLIDDLIGLRPKIKLLCQLLICVFLFLLAAKFGLLSINWLAVGITLIWLPAITNAFNLLDNMDGLSAGVASLAAVFLTVIAILNGNYIVGLITTSLVGCLWAFLFFNFRPAQIFMGDSGSLLIGFILAIMAANLRFPKAIPIIIQYAVPFLILIVPIVDTAFVSIMRRRHGRSIFQGGKDHLSHRLAIVTKSETASVLILYALTVLGGLVGLGMLFLSPFFAILFSLVLVFCLFTVINTAVRINPYLT